MNLDTSQQVLKTNGVIATYSSSQMMQPEIPFYPLMFNNTTLQLVLVYNMPTEAKIAAAEAINDAPENIARLVASRLGSLRRPDDSFGLAQCRYLPYL